MEYSPEAPVGPAKAPGPIGKRSRFNKSERAADRGLRRAPVGAARYSVPFVEGIAPFCRASTVTATRSARATALNSDSAM